jgi:hypothetical protein
MEIKDVRKEIFADNEALREVERIRQDILKRGVNNIPEGHLADAILTLSVYMTNIGQLFIDLACQAEDLEDEYKQDVNRAYLELKDPPSGEAKKISDKMAQTLAEEKVDVQPSKRARQTYNFVMRYYKDIERLISVAQSKLRVGASEMVRSNQ